MTSQNAKLKLQQKTGEYNNSMKNWRLERIVQEQSTEVIMRYKTGKQWSRQQKCYTNTLVDSRNQQQHVKRNMQVCRAENYFTSENIR